MDFLLLATAARGEILTPSDRVEQHPPFATKRAMEFAHLQHFKRLLNSQLSHLRFRLIGDGSEPPDFVISRDGLSVGLELTVFAEPERRERAAFFCKLQDRLLHVCSKGRLRRLCGIKIDLAFRELGARPFTVDDANFEQLVNEFDELGLLERPETSNGLKDSSGMVTYWPSGKVGLIEWCVSGYSNLPWRGSKLSNATGFEVEYTHRQWTSTEDVVRAINKSITAKDREGQGTDELLIVAGGPDQAGRAFPAEAFLADHALKSCTESIVKPTYIKRVFVDIWGLERLYLLHEKGAVFTDT